MKSANDIYEQLPEYIIHVSDDETGMRGIVVLDSTKRGPAKGGIRMAVTVDEEEVRGLARAMTLKTALADLPFGGGKSGILADPKKLSDAEKEVLVRAFARKLRAVSPSLYVAAPDIAMGEKEMRWIVEEIGRGTVTGKPQDIGGIPHELGSTGWGVFVAGREALHIRNERVAGMRVAVQGFGNVGSFAAKYFVDEGAVLVAASDSSATLVNTKGLSVNDLFRWKQQRRQFIDYPDAIKESPLEVLSIECDVLIPAAQKHIVDETNAGTIRARYIIQGANLPLTKKAEIDLISRGIVNVPDILANAGGVISSYIEHIDGNESEVYPLIEKTISENMRLIANGIKEPALDARTLAIEIAKHRLVKRE